MANILFVKNKLSFLNTRWAKWLETHVKDDVGKSKMLVDIPNNILSQQYKKCHCGD